MSLLISFTIKKLKYIAENFNERLKDDPDKKLSNQL